MTEASESYEARHRQAAEYLEQHKPARDPAGEVEVAWWSCALCGFSAAIICKRCRSARHMPAPRGATCSERHHEYQTPARPSSPAGEGEDAPRAVNPGFCPSCLKPDAYCICVLNAAARPSSPIGETPCSLPDADHMWSAPKADGSRECLWCFRVRPTGETAGQGVEEAWVRGSDWDGYVTYLNPSTGGREKVSLAVEQAIRAQFVEEARAAGMSIVRAAQARATAAEAERDRYREALEEIAYIVVCSCVIQPNPADDVLCEPHALISHALAGESTGAGEGE